MFSFFFLISTFIITIVNGQTISTNLDDTPLSSDPFWTSCTRLMDDDAFIFSIDDEICLSFNFTGCDEIYADVTTTTELHMDGFLIPSQLNNEINPIIDIFCTVNVSAGYYGESCYGCMELVDFSATDSTISGCTYLNYTCELDFGGLPIQYDGTADTGCFKHEIDDTQCTLAPQRAPSPTTRPPTQLTLSPTPLPTTLPLRPQTELCGSQAIASGFAGTSLKEGAENAKTFTHIPPQIAGSPIFLSNNNNDDDEETTDTSAFDRNVGALYYMELDENQLEDTAMYEIIVSGVVGRNVKVYARAGCWNILPEGEESVVKTISPGQTVDVEVNVPCLRQNQNEHYLFIAVVCLSTSSECQYRLELHAIPSILILDQKDGFDQGSAEQKLALSWGGEDPFSRIYSFIIREEMQDFVVTVDMGVDPFGLNETFPEGGEVAVTLRGPVSCTSNSFDFIYQKKELIVQSSDADPFLRLYVAENITQGEWRLTVANDAFLTKQGEVGHAVVIVDIGCPKNYGIPECKKENRGLHPGIIAAIVIGGIILLAFVAFMIYYFYNRQPSEEPVRVNPDTPLEDDLVLRPNGDGHEKDVNRI